MDLSAISKEHILQAADTLLNQPRARGVWVADFPSLNANFPVKQLIRQAYLMATGKTAPRFTSSWHKRNWFENLTGITPRLSLTDNLPFFNIEELEFFSSVAGKVYAAGNAENVAAGESLRTGILRKTNVWVRAVDVDGYVSRMDRQWQMSGYFKKYTWARLFKNADEHKKIFFTVGVEAAVGAIDDECLVVKLDCQRSNYNPENALTIEQVQRFDNIVKHLDASWHQISSGQLKWYNWAKLIEETEEFMSHYDALYDEVINEVWGTRVKRIRPEEPAVSNVTKQAAKILIQNGSVDVNEGFLAEDDLVEYEPPTGITAFAERKKLSGGVDFPDYDAEVKQKKNIGTSGEELVMQYEIKRLTRVGRADLASNIQKMPDWKGYDLLSFEADGKERYIEVKTTTGSIDRPFIMSWHERYVM